MTDERLRRWLEAAEQPLSPSPEFAATLHAELRAELGFESPAAVRGAGIKSAWARRGRRSGASRLLLVAALVVVGTISWVAVVGTRLERSPGRPSALFALIEAARGIRIAVRPDHPQFPLAGGATVGFDTDVAGALAQRMGLGLQGPVVVSTETQLRHLAAVGTSPCPRLPIGRWIRRGSS